MHFSLIIALLGVTANTIFWFRYKRLAKAEGSAILQAQSKLYCAKSPVDFCVSAALLAVMLAPVLPFLTTWILSALASYPFIWGTVA